MGRTNVMVLVDPGKFDPLSTKMLKTYPILSKRENRLAWTGNFLLTIECVMPASWKIGDNLYYAQGYSGPRCVTQFPFEGEILPIDGR